MIRYPLEFTAKTSALSGVNTNWNTEASEKEICISIPPEFMGPGGGISPEDLFGQALANCFAATFKVYAENSRLNFEKLVIESKLIVDLDEKKRPVMKEFFLNAKITSPSNSEKALLLAKKASESGFILNSVKTVCHFHFEIE